MEEMTRITEQTIKDILIGQDGWTQENDFGVLVYYRSPCKRYVLQSTEWNNMCDPVTGWGWNLHIDNRDMCSLASCDVEFIEQVKQIMEIYKDY